MSDPAGPLPSSFPSERLSANNAMLGDSGDEDQPSDDDEDIENEQLDDYADDYDENEGSNYNQLYPIVKLGTTIKNNRLMMITTSPGVTYSFSLKHDNKKHQSWTCVGCKAEQARLRRKKEPVPTVGSLNVSKDDLSMALDDISNLEHICEGSMQSVEFVESEQVLRLVSRKVENVGMAPSEALLEYDIEIAETHPIAMSDPPMIRNVKSMKRRMQRHKNKDRPKNIDPLDIPVELQNSFINGGGLIVKHFATVGKPCWFLADDYSIRILAGAEDLVMDGTFSRAPPGTKQVYSVHAVYTDGPAKVSSFVGAVILLPGATEELYVEELTRLRTLMEDSGGFKVRRFHVDCEDAVINAIQRVFPEANVVLCYFHYVKALSDWLNRNGGKALKRHPAFKEFLFTIQGSVFLPAEVYRIEMTKILKNLPKVGSDLMEICRKFANYVGTYWHSRADYLRQVVNKGPRTTNMAEGYHKMLLTLFTEPHPHFGFFLQRFKQVLRAKVIEFRNSANGTILNTRSQLRVRSDLRIEEAKTEFMRRYEQGLVTLPEVQQYCRHQSRNASPKNYDANHPDGTYPNPAAFALGSTDSDAENEPIPDVQIRRSRMQPIRPTRAPRRSGPYTVPSQYSVPANNVTYVTSFQPTTTASATNGPYLMMPSYQQVGGSSGHVLYAPVQQVQQPPVYFVNPPNGFTSSYLPK